MSLVERALKKLQQSGTLPEGTTQSGEGARAERTPERSVRLPISPRVDVPASIPEQTIERPSRIVKIDREQLRSLKLLPPPSMERRISSEYRQIKRPLIDAALGRSDQATEQAQVIMLASALPGEGKTFTSINLALSMAREKDVEVILINGDVAKPHLDALLGLEGERGLLDLLSDRSLHPDSVILATDVPNLRILPAGRKMDTATELLASERMKDLMAQLAAQDPRRIILLDSPPLLLSTESQALVASVGQIVLIVRAEITSESAVLAAIEATGGSKPISLILNQSTVVPSDGYYYGYGSYGEATETESK